MARELEPIVKKLSKEGNTVYSFSKLGAFNQCQYEYYITYILGDRGIDNIYSITGSGIHSDLESIYEGKNIDLLESLNNTLSELEMLNINFMNDKVRDSWVADMEHFCENFIKPEGEYITEQGFIFEVMPKVYIQGYIDLTQKHNKDTISIFDFKTSSKFDKKKLIEAGRQLVLYGLANEDKYKIQTIAWNMLKYLYVCSVLKNGKINKKMCNRGKWVKEIGTDTKTKDKKTNTYKITKSPLKRDLESLGYQEFEIDIILSESVKNNNINNLPESVQLKYWLEDCILEYEFNKEKKNELLEYIKKTHKSIIEKNHDKEDEWQPRDIENDNFYCSNLCNHRKRCKYLMEYYERLKLGETKKDSEWEDLFG